MAAEGEAQAGFCPDTLPRLVRVQKSLAASRLCSPVQNASLLLLVCKRRGWWSPSQGVLDSDSVMQG